MTAWNVADRCVQWCNLKPGPRLIHVHKKETAGSDAFVEARTCRLAYDELIVRPGYKSLFHAQLGASFYFKPGFDVLLFESNTDWRRFATSWAGLPDCGIKSIALDVNEDRITNAGPYSRAEIIRDMGQIVCNASRAFETVNEVLLLSPLPGGDRERLVQKVKKSVVDNNMFSALLQPEENLTHATYEELHVSYFEDTGLRPSQKHKLPKKYTWVSREHFEEGNK